MSTLRHALLLIGIVIVSSVARWLLPREWFPFDLFLVAVVVVALRRSTMTAQLFGAAAGLLQDAYGGGIIGLNALSKTVVGFAVAGLSQAILIRGVVQSTLMILITTVADAFLFSTVSAAFGLPSAVEPLRLLARSAANAAVGFAVVLALRRRSAGGSEKESYEIA